MENWRLMSEISARSQRERGIKPTRVAVDATDRLPSNARQLCQAPGPQRAPDNDAGGDG